MINERTIGKIRELHKIYLELSKKNKNALKEIALAEIPEMVYNSNAIENSTLTFKDTEKILLHNIIPKNSNTREVYEAKNLANVTEFLLENPEEKLSIELILKLHKILLSNINDNVAGRFRKHGEWVRVANHLGANPEFVEKLIGDLINSYPIENENLFLDRIAHFHAEFETIHPFCDGNGRMGRVLINQQLMKLNFPPIIIQNKTKKKDYYPLFAEYPTTLKFDKFTELFALLLIESLNKRVSILKGDRLIPLSVWAKDKNVKNTIALNKAKRQTIPAFRLREKWMISEKFKE